MQLFFNTRLRDPHVRRLLTEPLQGLRLCICMTYFSALDDTLKWTLDLESPANAPPQQMIDLVDLHDRASARLCLEVAFKGKGNDSCHLCLFPIADRLA